MTGRFAELAPKLITRLMHDFSLKAFQAAAPVGNMGRESGGFTELREIGARPGEGGYGWCQWTGPRAHLFLNWCRVHHLDWTSDEGNYTYLSHELHGSYAYVVQHLRATRTLHDAVVVFEKYYERAGVVAMEDRIAWGEKALELWQKGAENV